LCWSVSNSLSVNDVSLGLLWTYRGPNFAPTFSESVGRTRTFAQLTPAIPELMDQVIDPAEWYERGLALRKAGLFKQAIKQFEKATNDQVYALKAHAQIGLCCKSNGRYEDAITAFRQALQSPTSSRKETVQILYVLGRTLESLGRVSETLEAYRWIRREDPGYRDVTQRILQLSSRKPFVSGRRSLFPGPRVKDMIRSWQSLLRPSR
jgi:tetratricopeptide (TPR) repeat protein